MHECASQVAKPLRRKEMTHISSLLLFVCIVPYCLLQFVLPSFYLHLFSWKFGQLLQQFETREFYAILTWTLKIKVKPESLCSGETCAFCPHSSTNSQHQGKGTARLGSHTFFGKQHVNFTGISFALPISAPHTMYS